LRIYLFLVLTLFAYVSGCTEADNEIAVAEKGEQPAEVAAAMQELSCESFEQNFAELIESSGDCNTGADCVVTEFGCPFGCANAVNKNKLPELQSAFLVSAESCRSCLYDCAIGPSTVLPVCRSGKCDFVSKN
jgi:hypothetical protein